MSNLMDPEALVTCPYNNAHRIRRKKMSTHIVKCRKNYHKDSSMTICLFNANHSIPETELQYHLENCPDRFNLDKQVLVPKDVDHTKFPIQNIEVENEENWDDENYPTYKPEEYCKKNVILRQAKVESASIRKNFRNEERHRIQKLKEMGPSSTESNLSNEVPLQGKFRSAPLVSTATNIREDYTYEDIQRIIQSQPPKAIITDPNYKPSFIRQNEVAIKPQDNAFASDTEQTYNASASNSFPMSSPHEADTSSQQEEEKFITQKSRRKVGKGRGRGACH